MAYKVFDYICPNEDCEDFEKSQEIFVKNDEIDSQTCLKCYAPLLREVPKVPGYVKGTHNPCKC